MGSLTYVLRAARRQVGLPDGTGELLVPEVRTRLVLAAIGSFGLAALDMAGVLAMVPMMQLVSGTPLDEGALGRISSVLGEPSDGALLAIVSGVIVVCFVAKDVVAILLRRWQLTFMTEQVVRTSLDMMRGYLSGPYVRHLNTNQAERVWLADGGVQIAYSNGVAAGLSVFTEVLTVGLLLLALSLVSPLVTLATLIYFGGASAALFLLLRRHSTRAGEVSAEASRASGRIALEAMGAAKEIKLRGAQDYFLADYERVRRDAGRASVTQQLLGELPKYLLEILLVVGIGVLALASSWQSSGQDRLLLLGVFVAASSRIVPSIMRLMAALGNIRFAHEAMTLVIRERREMREDWADDHAPPSTCAVPEGQITLRDVSFTYPGSDVRVLDHVNLTIPRGESVALVGGSGAGKSTMVDVILGLLKPGDGQVLAGGLDIRDNLPAWQQQLAVVPQDVHLLDATLAQNIAFDLPLDMDLISDVIARAQLEDLVRASALGVMAQVGDRGKRLSGGQRQRIGIARALYRQPHVLVLDEATSALDNETENRVGETIRALHGSLTQIIVAHRLTTVQHCDQVVLMDSGRVAGTGTFAELASSNPQFANLVRLGTLFAAAGRAGGS